MLDQFHDLEDSLDGPSLTLHLFRLNPVSKLLYYIDNRGDRLVVLGNLRKRVLRAVYDFRAYAGFTRTYNYLRVIAYFPKMKDFVDEYVSSCPFCKLSEPRRGQPYGDLNPLLTPEIPISVFSIDFVVGILISVNGYDYALLITYLTSKFLKLIISKTTFTVQD